MFKIKKNYLSVAGIRFSLPENFYIDIEGIEELLSDGLRLVLPEKACSISFVTTEVEYKSTVASLIDIFTDDVFFDNKHFNFFAENETGYKWLCKPQKSELNGLNCAYIKYETPYNHHYEIHFERISGFDRQLEVLLTVSKNSESDLNSILDLENVKAFYNSFSLDE